jgi:hypothetical protein
MWANHNYDPMNYIGKYVIEDKSATRVIMVEEQSQREKNYLGMLIQNVWFVPGVTINV